MEMQKKSKSKLSKLRMPDQMDEMESGMEVGSEMPESEGEMEMEPEMESELGEGEMSPEVLAAASDDDLMAEVEKRGLMRQMGKSPKMQKSDNYSEV